jgi:hypothetical protein
MRVLSPQHLRPLQNTLRTIRYPTTRIAAARMASTNPPNLNIENTNINTAPNVTLTEQQKTLIGSVLDLFAGRPSLAKLQLWKDNGVFEDPIAKAQGRKEFEAQWYGLQTAFSEIERLHHEVKSAGNPIEMDLKTRYVVKGVGAEKVMESVVRIFTDGDRISKVEDRWNGNLPDGAVANVSFVFPFSFCARRRDLGP